MPIGDCSNLDPPIEDPTDRRNLERIFCICFLSNFIEIPAVVPKKNLDEKCEKFREENVKRLGTSDRETMEDE